ncbi:MAG: hypothetical protein EOM87_02385 [Clostridia bacterium]|nr:hypothetical protein [Clostridia bacterium]
MALRKRESDKAYADDMIIKSVGACPLEANNQTVVAIAYLLMDKIKFCVMPVIIGKKYGYEDFLNSVKLAERVKHIAYSRDIYLCRESEGVITDIVERDNEHNVFADGFAEVAASKLDFCINDWINSLKPNTATQAEISAGSNKYEKNSLEYAVINAYNACLLGEVFDSEEFQIETKYNQRVRCEVRSSLGMYSSDKILLIKPVENSASGAVSYYETEKFMLIDGLESSICAYKITYTNYWGKYIVSRI